MSDSEGGRSDDPIPLPGDRFEPSEAGIALLGAEKLLGAADSLPGQGEGETGGAPDLQALAGEGEDDRDATILRPQSDGVEVPDLQEGGEPERASAASGPQAGEGSVGEDGTDGKGTPPEALEAGKAAADALNGSLELTEGEASEVKRLRERDREVRAHEQAHAATGGQYVRGGIQFEYQTGPDGRRYAVGGEVSVDTSPVAGDPQATIRKAQTIRQAALAPAEPSAQDRRAAAAAAQMEMQARQELVQERLEEGETAGGPEEALEAPEGAVEPVGPGGEGEEPQVSKGLEEGIGPEALGREGGIGASEPAADGGGEISGVGEGVEPGAADADRPRIVEGLTAVVAGERIEKIETVQVEGVEDETAPVRPSEDSDGGMASIQPASSFEEGAASVQPPAGPSRARLDYGAPPPNPGQLVDVYR